MGSEGTEVPKGARSKMQKKDLRGAWGLGSRGFLQTSRAWSEAVGRRSGQRVWNVMGAEGLLAGITMLIPVCRPQVSACYPGCNITLLLFMLPGDGLFNTF